MACVCRFARNRSLPRICALAIVISGLQAVSACSVNDFGMVNSQMHAVKGANGANGGTVRSLLAYGLHLDARNGDLSLTVGRYQSSVVFAPGCHGPDPVLTFFRLHGVHLRAGQEEVSLTLGYREHLRAIRLDRTASQYRAVSFVPQDPGSTFLDMGEASACQDKTERGGGPKRDML